MPENRIIARVLRHVDAADARHFKPDMRQATRSDLSTRYLKHSTLDARPSTHQRHSGLDGLGSPFSLAFADVRAPARVRGCVRRALAGAGGAAADPGSR